MHVVVRICCIYDCSISISMISYFAGSSPHDAVWFGSLYNVRLRDYSQPLQPDSAKQANKSGSDTKGVGQTKSCHK